MADYSAGNLEFKIQTVGSNATAIFSNLNKELKEMSVLLGTANASLTTLNTTVRGMSRLSFKWTDKFTNGMENMTKAITPFIDKLTMAEKSLSSLENIMAMAGKRKLLNTSAIDEIVGGGTTSKTAKNFSFNQFINKVYFLRNYTKQLSRNVSQILQNGIKYTETLNLWQVAMRNNRKEAEQFVNTMNRAYGISTETLMRYQAIFKNMLSSLGGINDNVSYQLSEYLTQMAVDYASLYNVSIERAMTTFQSVLSGQIRVIRNVSGYDISESTIFQLYQQLGGTKTMRQLTQTEKRLLRLYAVFQQMDSSGAVGDLSKTLGNTANQLRVLSESSKELTTWLGLILEQYIKPILKYLNATIITLTNIVKAIAKTSGLELFEGGNIKENLEDINEEIDKMQGKLLDFDKFSVLGGSSGSGATENLGLDTKLLNGLQQYQSILSNVSSETTKIANAWTNLFVKFDDDNNIIGLTDKFYNLLQIVKDSVVSFSILVSILKKSFIPVLITLYATNEAFRKTINKTAQTLLPIINDIISKLVPIFIDLTSILVKIVEPIIKVAGAIITILDKLKILEPLIFAIIGGIILLKGLKLLNSLSQMTNFIGSIATFLTKISPSIASMLISFTALGSILNSLDPELRKFVSTLSVILGLLVTIAGALTGGLAGAIVAGAGVGVILAGIKGYASSMKAYKNGGVVEDGIFTMSKGELVGNFNDGTTVVANNQQILQGIENGVYKAVKSALQGQSGNIVVNLDGKQIAKANVNNTAMALSNNYNVVLKPR